MIALEAYYIKDLINFEDFVEHAATASNNLAHGTFFHGIFLGY